MSAFVGLVFSFCAAVADNTSEPTLLLGYTVDGTCTPHLELTGTNKGSESSPVINGHTITWEWLEGGAEVGIDDQRFVVMKFSEA